MPEGLTLPMTERGVVPTKGAIVKAIFLPAEKSRATEKRIQRKRHRNNVVDYWTYSGRCASGALINPPVILLSSGAKLDQIFCVGLVAP